MGVAMYMVAAAERALGADSPEAGFFGKLRGRAAQAQRYIASIENVVLLWRR